LPIIFSDEPGIDKQLRRGRSRERGDIKEFYISRNYIALATSAITLRYPRARKDRAITLRCGAGVR
jgi:hypothetical protein